jgi:quercetin dioxygenase-like cupin family protein
MRFRRFDDLDEYVPPGHKGVVNRLLVGLDNGGEAAVSVWHGRLDPGGHSEMHTHPESLQVYVGLSGEMVVGDGDEEHVLVSMANAMIPAASDHFIENRSDFVAEILVISVPALR